MERWWIKRVVPHATKSPLVTRWEVQASRVELPMHTRFLTTIHPFRASLCDRAKERQQVLHMTVTHTAYGDEIVEVGDLEAPTPARPPERRLISAEEFEARR